MEHRNVYLYMAWTYWSLCCEGAGLTCVMRLFCQTHVASKHNHQKKFRCTGYNSPRVAGFVEYFACTFLHYVLEHHICCIFIVAAVPTLVSSLNPLLGQSLDLAPHCHFFEQTAQPIYLSGTLLPTSMSGYGYH